MYVYALLSCLCQSVVDTYIKCRGEVMPCLVDVKKGITKTVKHTESLGTDILECRGHLMLKIIVYSMVITIQKYHTSCP